MDTKISKRDAQIIAAMQSNEPTKNIEKRFGLSRARLWQIMTKHGYRLVKTKEVLAGHEDSIRADAKTMTKTQIAAHYGVSLGTMSKFLSSRKIKAARALRKGTYGVLGHVYGLWTIIDDTRHAHKGVRNVLARCACGKEKVINLRNMQAGLSRSCRNCSAKNARAARS